MVSVDMNDSTKQCGAKSFESSHDRQQFLLNGRMILLGPGQLAGMESNVTFNRVARVLVGLTLEDSSTKLVITSVRLNVERKVMIGISKKCVLVSAR